MSFISSLLFFIWSHFGDMSMHYLHSQKRVFQSEGKTRCSLSPSSHYNFPPQYFLKCVQEFVTRRDVTYAFWIKKRILRSHWGVRGLCLPDWTASFLPCALGHVSWSSAGFSRWADTASYFKSHGLWDILYMCSLRSSYYVENIFRHGSLESVVLNLANSATLSYRSSCCGDPQT